MARQEDAKQKAVQDSRDVQAGCRGGICKERPLL
jgi:hypothetical protein